MSGHFESHFPESGTVDYSDQSTNIDDAAIAGIRNLLGVGPTDPIPTHEIDVVRVGTTVATDAPLTPPPAPAGDRR